MAYLVSIHDDLLWMGIVMFVVMCCILETWERAAHAQQRSSEIGRAVCWQKSPRRNHLSNPPAAGDMTTDGLVQGKLRKI